MKTDKTQAHGDRDTTAAAREARLKAKLRANLARRKSASAERQAAEKSDSMDEG